MKSETRAKVSTAIKISGAATAEIKKQQEVTLREIEDIAKRYSGERSSMLAGIVGGTLGAAGGLAIHGAIIALTGPLGAALGAAVAVLAWRGPSYFRLERAIERVKLALDLIEGRLAKLPKNTPPEITKQLWDGYAELWTRFFLVAGPSVSSLDGPAVPLLTAGASRDDHPSNSDAATG